jgi:hypothetical protein
MHIVDRILFEDLLLGALVSTRDLFLFLNQISR